MSKNVHREQEPSEVDLSAMARLAEAFGQLDRITENVYRSLSEGDYSRTVGLMSERGKALEQVYHCLEETKKTAGDQGEKRTSIEAVVLRTKQSTEQVQQAIGETRKHVVGELRTLQRHRKLMQVYKQQK